MTLILTEATPHTLSVLCEAGIAFETCKNLSNVLESARKKIEPEPPTVEKIEEVVTNRYRMTPEELRANPTRAITYSYPRMTCMLLIRVLHRWSLGAVGRVYRKDHATVIHALKACSALYETDKNFRKDLTLICNELGYKPEEIMGAI